MQCSCLFETYLHDHSHRCAPPYRLVGVFSVQGWWHRSYCGAGRCHTCTHIHHEADPLLSLPGVSTLTVETKQSVSNKTQATRDKCWTVCTSEDSTVHYLSWYKQMIPCMFIHQFILIQPVTQLFSHISKPRVFLVMCKHFFKILQWQELVLSCVHSAANVTAFKIPFSASPLNVLQLSLLSCSWAQQQLGTSQQIQVCYVTICLAQEYVTPWITEDVTWQASAVYIPYQGDRSRNIAWQMFQTGVLIPKAISRTHTSWVVSCHKCSRGPYMSSWLIWVHVFTILSNKTTR